MVDNSLYYFFSGVFCGLLLQWSNLPFLLCGFFLGVSSSNIHTQLLNLPITQKLFDKLKDKINLKE